jgi:hypothetical protein
MFWFGRDDAVSDQASPVGAEDCDPAVSGQMIGDAAAADTAWA